MAKEVGVHPTTISRIWRAHGLRVLQAVHFLTSLIARRGGSLVDPPERAVVDEKSRSKHTHPARSSPQEGALEP